MANTSMATINNDDTEYIAVDMLERLPNVIDRLMTMLSNVGRSEDGWDSTNVLPMLLKTNNIKENDKRNTFHKTTLLAIKNT